MLDRPESKLNRRKDQGEAYNLAKQHTQALTSRGEAMKTADAAFIAISAVAVMPAKGPRT
jgi:hypothetical protein